MTRVLIAAASPIVRAGLETLIGAEPALELAGSFADLSAVEVVRPDVILTDVPFHGLSPPAETDAAVILLTAEEQPAWTRDAIRLGVRAVLPRTASAAEILAAVNAAASGLAVVDPADLESMLSTSNASQTAADASILTARELEVLRMVADGAANKTIAWKLQISEHTVKFHVASILSKLNASTRTEAVAIGIRKGMILL